MKKIFLVFMSLMFIMCLISCNDNIEKINIEFIIDSDSYIVEIEKGTAVCKDIIPLKNKDEVLELYYDNDYEELYDNSVLYGNKKIYVKTIKDQKLCEAACEAYWEQFIKINRENSTVEDVVINEYLGTYNNCFVAILLDKENCAFYDVISRFTIKDLEFVYSLGYNILVYSDGSFLHLVEAYSKNILTYEEIKQIHYNHYN